MLLESNNVIAENLARHVAIALGMPATFSGAADAVMTEARRLGVTTPIHLVDGSGLSPDDGIAPETLVRVLALAASRPQLRAVITGLPVAGFAGTLSAGDSDFGGIGGLGDGSARGVVRAKTGNLATVADAGRARVRPQRQAADIRDHGAAGARGRPAAERGRRDRLGRRRAGRMRLPVGGARGNGRRICRYRRRARTVGL